MANSASDQNPQALMSPQDIKADIRKRLSRRNWLRNAAMAATGAVVLPSFLTGCTKEQWDLVKGQVPGGGLGGVPLLTTEELQHAAANLNSMRMLLKEIYNQTSQYDETVFLLLNDTSNKNWQNFILDIFIDIAFGLAFVADIFAPGLETAWAAFSFFSEMVFEWKRDNAPERPGNLTDFFQEYQKGHRAMQIAIDEKLASLIDPANNYANLKAAWDKPIEYHGKTYTLADLAESTFPTEGRNRVAYLKMFNAMYDHHKKAVWNLALMKCCRMNDAFLGSIRADQSPTQYAREQFYSVPEYKGAYLRGNYEKTLDRYFFRYWYLSIDGYTMLSPEAAGVLFIDDTPEHSIKPDGLFHRSYVYEQFSIVKPKYVSFHELTKDYQDSPQGNLNFDYSGDDWTFTGGMFPELTKP